MDLQPPTIHFSDQISKCSLRKFSISIELSKYAPETLLNKVSVVSRDCNNMLEYEFLLSTNSILSSKRILLLLVFLK